MIITILLTIVAILGIVFQFKTSETKESKKRKKAGVYALTLSIFLLIANNFKQLHESNQLSNENEILIEKLDSCNSSIQIVGENQSDLKIKYDSLIKRNLNTEFLLSEANNKIEKLSISTKEGFDRNEKAINNIPIERKREISIEKRDRIIDILSQFKGAKVEFGTVNTSTEALQFSKELQSLFKVSGWTIETDEKWLAPSPDIKGIILFANKDKQPAYAFLAYNALNELGYKLQAINDPKFEENRLKIVVGFNE
jgi:hypothetical protein